MNFLFENLLAAKSPDENVWVQLIIVAVIIGFGIIKTIIRGAKAMMEQKSDEGESEDTDTTTSISAKPKNRYTKTDDRFKTLEQLREERIEQIRATYGIPEPPVQEEPQTISIEEPIQVVAPAAIERPIRHLKPQKPVTYTAPAAVSSQISAKKSKVHIPASQPARESVRKLLFSSSGDLRNAILYQEILGKPLALRDTV